MIQDIFDDLKRDEGFRSKPYHCTEGKVTIGYGRNLDDVGITTEEAEILLSNDIGNAIVELDRRWPWWAEMPKPAQRGLLNMCFQLGSSRLGKFKKMLAALEAGEFRVASDEALDSLWAQQTPERAARVARLIKQSGD